MHICENYDTCVTKFTYVSKFETLSPKQNVWVKLNLKMSKKEKRGQPNHVVPGSVNEIFDVVVI